MRSSTPANLGGRCPGCLLPASACLCALAPRLETPLEFLVLRHVKEVWKSSNTARLAALALPRCVLRDYGRPNDEVRAPADLSRTWLLFPDRGPQLPAGRPDRLVVLDGTWSQARRMVQRLPWLRGLPRLSLLPARPPDGLRKEPDEVGMPTLLAIARALELLEGPAQAAPLEALHGEFVRRFRALRGRPGRR